MPKKGKKTDYATIRLTPALKKSLVKEAGEKYLTLSKYLEILIEKGRKNAP